LVVLLALVFVGVAVLTAPLWAGYFGPRTAVYAKYWRPWRTQFEVTVSEAGWDPYVPASERRGSWPKEVIYSVSYHDPWSPFAHGDGEVSFWVWVDRFSQNRPWRVMGGFTG
jgi:hypothetical protein